MSHRLITRLTVLAAVALLLFGASQAMAAATDTEADTLISNTASVSYTINGGTPPDVTGTTEFRVDHKIRPFVTAQSGTTVVPGGTGYALKFLVTNDGNTKSGNSLELFLEAVEAVGNAFSMTNVKVYDDNSGTPGSEIADGLITLARDASATIWIVADAPAAGVNNADTSVYHLRATAYDGTGSALGEDGAGSNANANDADTTEAVFADTASTSGLAGDNAGDGKHSDSATYTASWTALTVNKTASNGGSGYHLPGDTVTYTVTVTNNDTNYDASSVTISDPIPTNTNYSAGTLTCGSGTPKWSTDNGTTYTTPEPGGTITNVQCENGSVVANGSTTTMNFDVTID